MENTFTKKELMMLMQLVIKEVDEVSEATGGHFPEAGEFTDFDEGVDFINIMVDEDASLDSREMDSMFSKLTAIARASMK